MKHDGKTPHREEIMARSVEDDNVFFFDTFLPLCEQSFRFNYFVSSSNSVAFACLHRVTEEFYTEIRDMEDTEQRLPHFIKHCWQGLEKSPQKVAAKTKDKVAAVLGKFSPEERAQLAALDCLGLSDEEAHAVFATDSAATLSDKVQETRSKLAKDKDYSKLKPEIQNLFRAVNLSEAQSNKLRDLILPGFDAQAAQDKVSTDAESGLKKESLRNYLILGICLIVIGVIARHFHQKPALEAKVIESLGYETLAIEEDPERLSFPSQEVAEIRAYFDNHRGLDFKPQLLKLPSRWELRGAGVIDYDFMRVAAIRYEAQRGDNILVHYSFQGKTENLPAAEEMAENFRYRSYASDQLNMIVWPQGKAVAVLVGRLSTEDLVVLGNTSQP